MPDIEITKEKDQRDDAGHDRLRQIGKDHHPLTVVAVGDGSADWRKQRTGQQNEDIVQGEVRDLPGLVEEPETDGKAGQHRTEGRDGLPDPDDEKRPHRGGRCEGGCIHL